MPLRKEQVEEIKKILKYSTRPLDKHGVYRMLENKGMIGNITSNQIKEWLDKNAEKVDQKGSYGSDLYIEIEMEDGEETPKIRHDPGAGLFIERSLPRGDRDD
jgi:hypothetical protein